MTKESNKKTFNFAIPVSVGTEAHRFLCLIREFKKATGITMEEAFAVFIDRYEGMGNAKAMLEDGIETKNAFREEAKALKKATKATA